MRSKQRVGVVIVPRRTSQHTVLLLSVIPIFAPLPYVASHVVQTTKIRLKASYRTSPWIAVVIAFNAWPSRSQSQIFASSPA